MDLVILPHPSDDHCRPERSRRAPRSVSVSAAPLLPDLGDAPSSRRRPAVRFVGPPRRRPAFPRGRGRTDGSGARRPTAARRALAARGRGEGVRGAGGGGMALLRGMRPARKARRPPGARRLPRLEGWRGRRESDLAVALGRERDRIREWDRRPSPSGVATVGLGGGATTDGAPPATFPRRPGKRARGTLASCSVSVCDGMPSPSTAIASSNVISAIAGNGMVAFAFERHGRRHRPHKRLHPSIGAVSSAAEERTRASSLDRGPRIAPLAFAEGSSAGLIPSSKYGQLRGTPPPPPSIAGGVFAEPDATRPNAVRCGQRAHPIKRVRSRPCSCVQKVPLSGKAQASHTPVSCTFKDRHSA